MPSDYSKIREDNIKEYGEGTRHLAFLGRLYTDRTHFIFELLQNAEDAGASRIRFRLFEDRLEVAHDGRPFNEFDVRGVCGVGEGTKAEDLTQIGKFGIGFKSVYAYTSTPEVHSGEENFVIEDYVRPSSRGPRRLADPWTTLFVFALNAEGVDLETARREIGACLRSLGTRTLLFLQKIKEIEYQLPDADGVYLRDETSQRAARKVEIVGQNNSKDENENWLIFERPVKVPDGSGEVCVEVGFRLETNTADNTKSIKRESSTPLVVYFPTEKETKLGFLIQGPYRTTPARDNIPRDDDWNKTLIKETAELVVESLRQLKEMDLLSVSLLEALPIRTDDFPEDGMFYPIFDKVSKALANEALLPSDDGTFVAARSAKLARGEELRKLLNQDQLHNLFQPDDEVKWLPANVTQDRTPDLRGYLMEKLKVEEITPEVFARNLSRQFLVIQDDEWFAGFYKFLSVQKALWRRPHWRGETGGILRNKPILRLQDGTHVTPFQNDDSPNAYLAVGTDTETSLPIVKIELAQDEEARKFLKELGIPELDIVTEVIEKVLPKYMTDEEISDEIHKQDISKIERAYKTDSSEKKNRLRKELLKTPFILVRYQNGEKGYCKADQVYFETDELSLYFSGNDSFACVNLDHPQAGLLRELGVSDRVRIKCESKPRSTEDVHLRKEEWMKGGAHRRGLKGFDPDISVDGLKDALETPSIEKSRIIWDEIAADYSHCVRGRIIRSSRQDFSRSASIYEEKEIISENFGKLLTNTAWLPDSDGNMNKPSELALDDLPESFDRDEKLADQLRMKKNVVAKLADELGVKQETIQLAKQLEENPEKLAEFRKFLTQKEESQNPTFPTRRVSNPERRRDKVSIQINDAPEKGYETRERSVRTTRGTIAPNTWLKNQYTNDDDQMICQICKEEMPFRKRDGEYYFEAVEAFLEDDFPKEYGAQFLALCPLCAARYKEFVKRDEEAMSSLHDDLKDSDKLEIPLKLGEWETSLQFVETHHSDIKTILRNPPHPHPLPPGEREQEAGRE